MQGQYRKPIDFTEAAIAATANGWETLREGLLFGKQFGGQLGWEDGSGLVDEVCDRFNEAMDDDVNTSAALAVIFELAKELRRVGNILSHGGELAEDSQVLQQQWQTLVALAGVLGLEAEAELQTSGGLDADAIEGLAKYDVPINICYQLQELVAI